MWYILLMTYPTKTFNISQLDGISEKQIKVHLGLYEGYVKHVNLIMEKLKTFKGDTDGDAYLATELRRRLAFEFNGMRMHEYYFEQFEGIKDWNPSSRLAVVAAEKYGSGENFIGHIKKVAESRGTGWVVVYSDPGINVLHTVFVNDHEVGQLAGLPIVFALDLWEHAYMIDYVPVEKKNYIDAFFGNLNWEVVEKRFEESVK